MSQRSRKPYQNDSQFDEGEHPTDRLGRIRNEVKSAKDAFMDWKLATARERMKLEVPGQLSSQRSAASSSTGPVTQAGGAGEAERRKLRQNAFGVKTAAV